MQGSDPLADANSRVTKIDLCSGQILLYVGEVTTLIPVPRDLDDRAVTGAEHLWSSSDETIVVVTSWGEVDALSAGFTTVTVQIGSAQASVDVEVRDGTRPRLNDAQWDAINAGLCDDDGTLKRGSADSDRATREGDDEQALGAEKLAFNIDGSGPDNPAANAASPENEVGLPRFGPIEAAVGNPINVTNAHGSASYSFAAPVISLAGRESTLDLALTYNSQVWEKEPAVGSTPYKMTFNYTKGYPAAGWRLGFGRIIENYDDSATSTQPGNALLITADGTRKVLEQYLDTTSTPNVYKLHTTDGTFLKYNPNNGKLKYPDGAVVTYENNGQTNGRRLPTSIQTPNGNILVIKYRQYDATNFPLRWGIDFVKDTLDRKIDFVYADEINSADHSARLLRIDAPDFVTGLPHAIVELRYKDILFQYNFSTTNIDAATPSGGLLTVLDRIYYPDTGTGYVFDNPLDATDTGYSTYGMIVHVSRRVGMTSAGDGTEIAYTKYNYPTGTSTQLNGNPRYTTRIEWWSGMTDAGGNSISQSTGATHTYAQATPGTNKTYTVTTPSSPALVTVQTVNNDSASINYGKVLSVEFYTGSVAAANLRRKITYAYGKPANSGGSVQGWTDQGLQRTTETTTETDGSTSRDKKLVYVYSEKFGRLSSLTEYDFGSPPSTVLRSTGYTYYNTINGTDYTDTNQQNGNFLNLIKEVTVSDASTVKSRSLLTYDSYATIPLKTYASGPPPQTRNSLYDSASFTLRANATSSTRYLNPTAPSQAVVRNTGFDVFGNTVRADVSCCVQKNFAFVATGMTTSTTGFSQPEEVTDGDPTATPHLTSKFSYDYYTGLVLSRTDPRNHQVLYDYDAARRLTDVQEDTRDGAAASLITRTTVYDDANMSVSQTLAYTENGASRSTTSKTWVDGGGRILRSGTSPAASGSYDAVKITYDAVGRPTRQSVPYAGNATGDGSPAGYTVTTYDAISRVTLVTLPDGGTVTTSYTGWNTITVTDQVNRKNRATVDGAGRRVKIEEQDPLSGTGAFNWSTTYAYDVFDNVTTVQLFAPSSTTSSQQRSSIYDAFGRLTDQTTPEGGSEHFAYTDFDALKKYTDGRNVETHYQFDEIARTKKIWYTGLGGSDDPTVSRPPVPGTVAAVQDVDFTYSTSGTNNGLVTRIDGKTASDENYTYDTAGLGRVTSRVVKIDGVSHNVGYTYNGLGLTISTTYPSNRVVNTSHDNRGRLSTVTGSAVNYISATSYQTSGLIGTIAMGDQTTETYTYSPTRLQLTNQKVTKTGVTTPLLNLNYSYTAGAGSSGAGTTAGNAGQLMAITNTGSTSQVNGASAVQAFTYDNVGRLVTATGSANATATGEGDTGAVFRASTAAWFERNSNSTGPADNTFTYGGAPSSFVPIKGDWDANGTDTPGLYDPASGSFFLRNSNSSGVADVSTTFGVGGAGFIPLSGDWDGNGTDTLGVYDPVNSAFFLRNSLPSGGADVTASYGPPGSGWKPIVGDWDGNGTDTLGLYDPSTGTFFLRNSNTPGTADLTISFGATNLTPLAGDWDGDGVDTIGVFAGGNFFLRNSNTTGTADITYTFGISGDVPLVGNWDGQSVAGSGSTWGRRYEYDRWGNRTKVYDQTVGGAAIQTVNYGTGVPTNRVVGYSYDGAGNLLTDGVYTSTYDAAGRQATSQPGAYTYAYDAANRRTKKTVSGATTRYIWESGVILAELDVASGQWTDYIYAGDRMIARETAGGVTARRYFHKDRLSTRLMTSSSGAVKGTASNYPFGEDAGSAGELTKQRFTSYERDSESGTDYAWNRQYGTGLGRFTRPDPILGSIGNPQTMNRYAYVANDPINAVDPTGLYRIAIWTCYTVSDDYGDSSTECEAEYYDFPDPIVGGPVEQGGGAGGATGTPVVGGTKDKKAINDFNNAFAEALARLNDPKCAGLFGGQAAATAALTGATYRYGNLGKATKGENGAVSVTGAATYKSPGTTSAVTINTYGPFRNTTVLVTSNGRTDGVTLDFNSNLRGAQFGALLLLHELGHLVGVFGPDAKNPTLNQSYTDMVLKDCFGK